MKFKKEDENYIYEVIGKNIKKYRKLKGWTQEKLAEEIDYSLSFISGIESSYHQTFSLGALWRISQALEVDFKKLCDDSNNSEVKSKYILYKCDNCNIETKIPIKVFNHFKSINELYDNLNLPTFDCTECNGKLKVKNPLEL